MYGIVYTEVGSSRRPPFRSFGPHACDTRKSIVLLRCSRQLRRQAIPPVRRIYMKSNMIDPIYVLSTRQYLRSSSLSTLLIGRGFLAIRWSCIGHISCRWSSYLLPLQSEMVSTHSRQSSPSSSSMKPKCSTSLVIANEDAHFRYM